MPSGLAGPEAARVLQWMEDGATIFEHVRRLLHEYDQATEAARAAQAERDRLQQQCEALREEARQLHAALGRLQKERSEAAHWFATMLQEAAARFPLTPPPA
jgi:predicted  nucleic acid-binding Zn-ribbon protein